MAQIVTEHTTAELRNLPEAEYLQILATVMAEDAATAERLNRPDALGNAAAYYARRGIRVFPCAPRGKTPIVPHWKESATTDLTVIAAWWRATPAANIALPTGFQFDVIDVDGHTGYESFAELAAQGHIPAAIGRAHTAGTVNRTGKHLYTAPTGDGNATAVRPGIDYRGRGGYVIAPPSIGPEGKRYSWITPLQPLTQA